MKVLQLTDIHVDPNYLPGGNAECEDHNCCRVDQGEPINASAAAGYWGDYRDCDTPYHAFENMLQQATSHDVMTYFHFNYIKNITKFLKDLAYIIFTGDIIDHGRWATSIATNRNTIIYAMTAMLNAFPSVKILPIFGNHEPHPTHK
jgi:sphingomyelin phosphodiesterase